jgi:hypothetical protein
MVTLSPGFHFRTVEEPEGRERLEDRRPHGVEVDGRRHDGDVRLVGGQLGGRHVLDVDGLVGVLLLGGEALEHLHLVLQDDGGPERLRDRDRCELLGGCAVGEELGDVGELVRHGGER